MQLVKFMANIQKGTCQRYEWATKTIGDQGLFYIVNTRLTAFIRPPDLKKSFATMIAWNGRETVVIERWACFKFL